MKGPARLFVCHAPADEELLDQLNRHLSQMEREGVLSTWDARRIAPGDDIHDEVAARLRDADLVLLLISADFMASKSCDAFVQLALSHQQTGQLRVVPVLVRPTDWETGPFGGCAPLPSNRKPVTRWDDRDEAWLDVVTGLRRLLRQHARSSHTPWAPANPYRGLEAFEPEDDELFFGREALIDKLWQAYQRRYKAEAGLRLLAILGPSGSGKSSVARAGLIPVLRRQPVPGKRASQVVLFKPGERPIERLARAILPLLPGPPSALQVTLQLQSETVLRHLNERGEADGLRRLAMTLPDIERAPLVVVVDQFEEAYVQCKNPAERDLFVALLLHAAADREGYVSVVLTLRSDFLGETHHHSELNQAITGEPVVVGVMSEVEMIDAIARPAAHAGQPLPESTVKRLLEQTRGREGALPLLEFALQRIWEGLLAGKKPSITLREIGGVGGALATRAQELFDSLSAGEQVVARRLFLGLVQLGEGARDTRRRVALKELVSHGENEALVREVARRFSQPGSRLVTIALGDGGDELVEVTHEALFKHWKLLQGWIGTGREDLRFHRRLEEAAADWEQRQRPAGLLWRSPDLDLLGEFHRRAGRDMTDRQVRFWRESEQAKRYGRLRALLTIALAVMAVISAVIIWAIKERERTQEARKFAHDAEQALLATYVDEGRRELLRGDSLKAALWLERAYGKAEGPQVALRSLLAEAMIPLDAAIASLAEQRETVATVAFSPDGTRLLTTSNHANARLWEVKSGKRLAAIEGPKDMELAGFSPDLTRVITAGRWDTTASLWDIQSGKLLARLKHPEGMRTRSTLGWGILVVAFSPDGTYAFTGSMDHTARLWDGHDGRFIASLEGHQDGVSVVAFSPNGKLLVTGSGNHEKQSADFTAKLWDVRSRKLMASLVGHTDEVQAVAFSPDGMSVLTGSADQTAKLWDVQDGRLLATLKGHQRGVTAVAFCPDGKCAITGSMDKTAKLWDVQNGNQLSSLDGHLAGVTTVRFSPDGMRLLTGSQDGTAKLWNVQSGKFLVSLDGHRAGVDAVAFSPDGTQVVTGGSDETVKLWNVKSGKQLASLKGHRAAVATVSFSPDGTQMLTGSWDGTAQLWDVRSGRQIVQLNGHADGVTNAAFSPDGTAVLTGSDDHTAMLWDAKSGKLRNRLQGHEKPVTALQFSADGARVLTGSDDHTAKLWDVRSGELLKSLEGHQDTVTSVAFSPDGERVLTGSSDKTARLWNARSGEVLTSFEGHAAQISAVVFSRDATAVLTASFDKTAKLWDARSGKLIATLKGHQGMVQTMAISSDGERVLTGSKDGSAKLWHVRSQKLLASLEGHKDSVAAAVFSPDGTRAVTGAGDARSGGDSTVRLWDAHNGKLLGTLSGHRDSVMAVAFSPDGSRILTGSKDKTAILWDVHLEVRSKAVIHDLVRCRVPFHLEGEVIVPVPNDRQGCNLFGQWSGGQRDQAKPIEGQP